MIKDITISRSLVSPSVCDPAQWSGNMQLAINCSKLVIILDPKLPNLYKSIISRIEFNNIDKDHSTINNTLNSHELFDTTTILSEESLIGLDVGKFNKIFMSNDSPEFSFNRINEPTYVKHQWSEPFANDKDCFLGVLLNTGELLVLRRSGKFLDQYKVVYNFFDVILQRHGIEDEEEIILDKERPLKPLNLKVKDFHFVMYLNTLYVAILTGDNDIEFYADGVLSFAVESTSKEIQYFLPHTVEDRLYIAVVTTDNEIGIADVSFNKYTVVQQASRFRVSKLIWLANDLVVALPSTVLVISAGGQVTRTKSMGNNVASLVALSLNEVLICYEFGGFEVLSLTTKSITKPEYLAKFVSQRLMEYQLSNSLSEDSKSNTNFEGNMMIYNATINEDGILAITYQIYPKNTLNYKILSKSTFSIGFIPVRDSQDLKPYNHIYTSLRTVNLTWFRNYNKLLMFPKHFQIASAVDFIDNYLHYLKKFRNELPFLNPVPVPEINVSEETLRLEESLVLTFTNHEDIQRLQFLYNVDMVIVNAIQSLISMVKSVDFPKHVESPESKLEDFLQDFEREQTRVEHRILSYLIDTIISNKSLTLNNEIDKFIILSYYLKMGKSFALPFEDDSITITVSNSFVTESFSISKNDDYKNLCMSDSGHLWTRCTLTLLPIIDEVNGTDELKKFNYIIPNPTYGELANSLLSALNYCIITGNKVYST